MSYNTFTPIVTNGLVLYLDAANTKSYSGTGTSWLDLSKNGNNGTLTNGPTYNSSNSGTISFNGTTQYIDNVGNVTAFSFIQNTNIFSINFWFKVNLLNIDNIFMSNDNGTTGEKGFFLGFRYLTNYGFNALGMYVTRGVGSFLTNIGSTNDNIITDTNWHNGCYVSNNTTIGQWYVDGIPVTTTNRSAGLTIDNVKSSGDSTRVLTIGKCSTDFFNGGTSNTLIYNRALSASEVLQNYNATKFRFQ